MDTIKAMGIYNYQVYLKGMKKSYQDKLFFIDKINNNVNRIIDFGCADGTLLKYINEYLPDVRLIGYDIDQNMIKHAKKEHNFIFTTNFEECIKDVDVNHTLLNLSSVLHEVYSYSHYEDIEIFWKRVFNNQFEYIAIRDLCASESINRPSNIKV